MVSLGQKLKMPKTSEKPFYKTILQKQLEKTPNIREMRAFQKSAILQRLYSFQNGQLGTKTKNVRNTRKTILKKH